MQNVFHTINKNRRINKIFMIFMVLYCIWLILTLIFNFKWFIYSIETQGVICCIYYLASWIYRKVYKLRH